MKKTSGGWFGILVLAGIVIILISIFTNTDGSADKNNSNGRYVDCTMCHATGKCYHYNGNCFPTGKPDRVTQRFIKRME